MINAGTVGAYLTLDISESRGNLFLLAGPGQRLGGVGFYAEGIKSRGRAHRCNALRRKTSPGAEIAAPVFIRPTPIYVRARFARSHRYAKLSRGALPPDPCQGTSPLDPRSRSLA